MTPMSEILQGCDSDLIEFAGFQSRSPGLTEIVDLGEMTKNTDIKLRGTELKGLSIYVPRHIRMSYDL